MRMTETINRSIEIDYMYIKQRYSYT
uniref:Uncharacterized protein n=1 Tax=Tetranychus urticae TaxID=32264 RepID=T1JQX8_TETUR